MPSLTKEQIQIGNVLESWSYKIVNNAGVSVRVVARVDSLTKTGIPRLRLQNINDDTLKLTNNRTCFNAHVRDGKVYMPLYPPVYFRGVYVNYWVRIVNDVGNELTR